MFEQLRSISGTQSERCDQIAVAALCLLWVRSTFKVTVRLPAISSIQISDSLFTSYLILIHFAVTAFIVHIHTIGTEERLRTYTCSSIYGGILHIFHEWNTNIKKIVERVCGILSSLWTPYNGVS